jgi:hypothetical protein
VVILAGEANKDPPSTLPWATGFGAKLNGLLCWLLDAPKEKVGAAAAGAGCDAPKLNNEGAATGCDVLWAALLDAGVPQTNGAGAAGLGVPNENDIVNAGREAIRSRQVLQTALQVYACRLIDRLTSETTNQVLALRCKAVLCGTGGASKAPSSS